MNTPVDVLVVGAGPTGSVMAIDLARRGIKVRIIEKSAHSFPGSRGKGLQPRTLEMLYDLGTIEPIIDAGGLYPVMGVHQGSEIVPHLMYNNVDPSADKPYPNTWLIAQYKTDAILHQRLTALGVQVEFNTQLVVLEQNEDSVSATLKRTSGEEESVSAQYLVGADGGASTVRNALAVPFPGKTDESDRMIIVDGLSEGLGRDYWHAWMGENNRFTVACPLPDGDAWQWMMQLQEGEEPELTQEALNQRIANATQSDDIRLREITWTTVFRPNIRLADRYRVGRVFLAGDAAHSHTPMGAQGLNTGVQDAYNLGWKLQQVLNGAPDSLLDSYEAERQPIAAAVLETSTKKYEAAARADEESLERGKDEQQLLITYRAGPLGRGDRSGTTTLSIGDRAPNAELLSDDGALTSVHALLRGPHFSLLAFGAEAAAAVQDLSWPSTGAPLRCFAVDSDMPGALRDSQGSMKAIYGLDGDAIICVRPDGYILDIGSPDESGYLREKISRVAPAHEIKQS
ncbi:MAG: FAD-dependent monooxygenase [Pseudomonadota bacterium]